MSLITAQKIIYYDAQAPGTDVPNFHLGAPAHNLGARENNATPSGSAAPRCCKDDDPIDV